MSSQKQQQENESQQNHESISSTATSISLIKLDELSSFGATKQNRLPTLIRLTNNHTKNSPSNEQQLKPKQINSMPVFGAEQIEMNMATPQQQTSLPARLESEQQQQQPAESARQDQPFEMAATAAATNKENARFAGANEDDEDFQMVDMVGPSLPQPDKLADESERASGPGIDLMAAIQNNTLNVREQLLSYPSNIGDSLIEMIINLRNENQNLVRALEANNEYVKERISEFKRVQEEARKREAQFALEKADLEHEARKLRRQNGVLSERLKGLEAKLSSMKLEVDESLEAARSSKASSMQGDQQQQQSALYPNLGDDESFSNQALNQTTTMQIDATSGELLNDGHDSAHRQQHDSPPPTAPPMEIGDQQQQQQQPSAGRMVGELTREQLSERFDANKSEFSALAEDPMKQCDKLEKQLNDIGKRDYEICLLQQQLNIYRQDFRLERMEKLEARIQIEKLKNDIDRLCLERLKDRTPPAAQEQSSAAHESAFRRSSSHARRSGSGVRFEAAAAAAESVIGKLGHHMSKKAAKSAAKAAKYAAKQAHREERATAAAAAAAAAAASSLGNPNDQSDEHHGHHRRHHHGRHHRASGGGIRSEVVNDLLTTANKAMLTGYKMASTHVNLALDKLGQFEQQQAANLAANQQQPSTSASAPPMSDIHHN